MRLPRFLSIIVIVSVLSQWLAGCAALEPDVANGGSVRAIVAAQVNDPFATERNGANAPIGTDSEVAAAAVKGVRERGRESSSKPGLLDVLFGGAGRK